MFSERGQTWKTTDCMIPFSMKFPEKAKSKRHKVVGGCWEDGWNKTEQG